MNVQNYPNVPKAFECDIPPETADLMSLRHVDYQDAFCIGLPAGAPRDAEEWARSVFRPASAREALLLAAIGLGLGAARPAPKAPGVGAFNVLRSSPDAVLMETLTRIGLVQIVVSLEPPPEPRRLLLATFVAYRDRFGRANFEMIVRRGHRRAVPYLLGRAVTRQPPCPRLGSPRWTS